LLIVPPTIFSWSITPKKLAAVSVALIMLPDPSLEPPMTLAVVTWAVETTPEVIDPPVMVPLVTVPPDALPLVTLPPLMTPPVTAALVILTVTMAGTADEGSPEEAVDPPWPLDPTTGPMGVAALETHTGPLALVGSTRAALTDFRTPDAAKGVLKKV